MILHSKDFNLPTWASIHKSTPSLNGNLYLIKEEEEIVGYAIVTEYDQFCQLEFLEVERESRNLGHGTRLLQYIISHYENIIVIPIYVAYPFYIRNGFQLLNKDSEQVKFIFTRDDLDSARKRLNLEHGMTPEEYSNYIYFKLTCLN